MIERGQCLGRFRVVSLLGIGGMGEVYRAHDPQLGRDVALKILPASLAGEPLRRARLEREARLLAALNHSGIATIHELFETDGAPVLVMEFVEGDTLVKSLRRGAVPVRQALTIGLEIATALEAAHAKGIVHHDLKPSNIAIGKDGHVKLLDFGLGKVVEHLGDADSSAETVTAATDPGTASRAVLGTAPYMSPEQTRGQEVDKRTDIWAFGCVLYELLAGQRAFPGTSTDALAAVLRRDPEWQALPAETPRTIVKLLRRCLHKARGERLQDIGDARLEITEALEEFNRTPSRIGGRRARLLMVAVLLVLGTGVLALRRMLPPAVPPSAEPVQEATASSSESSPARTSSRSLIEIDHAPIACMVAGQFAVIEASIKPAKAVARARVLFKGTPGTAFYYVDMVESDGRFVGTLPKPRIESGPVTYYVAAYTGTVANLVESAKTPERNAVVVAAPLAKSPSDPMAVRACPAGASIAAFGALNEVTVFSSSFGSDLVLSLNDAFGLEDLLATLRDPDPRVREGAATSLSEIGPPTTRAIATVVRSLKDPDPTARASAASSLSVTGRRLVRQTMTSLLKSLQDDTSPAVRRASAMALGEIGPGVAAGVTGLRVALRDQDPDVRRNTAEALGSVGSVLSSAMAALETASDSDKDESVQDAARRAHAKIRAKFH